MFPISAIYVPNLNKIDYFEILKIVISKFTKKGKVGGHIGFFPEKWNIHFEALYNCYTCAKFC